MSIRVPTLVKLFAIATTINGALAQNRITGGEPAAPGKFDFYVYLSQGCAGSLIANDVVITAAHCVDVSDYNLSVSVGAYASQISETRRVVANVLHPSYRPSRNMDYDIILLKLDQPVNNIAPVQINTDGSIPRLGDNLTVIGYLNPQIEQDATTERQYDGLYQGNLSALPYATCEYEYGDMWTGDSTMLCAGNGANGVQVYNCPGDTGGPLLDSNNAMVGIVSTGTSCGDKQTPGIYTRTSHFAEWIQFQACVLSNVRPSFCSSPGGSNATSHSVTVTINIDATLSPVNDTQAASQLTTLSAESSDVLWSYTDGITISVDTGAGEDTGLTAQGSQAPTTPQNVLSLRLDIFYDDYAIENAWKLRYVALDKVIDEKSYYTVAPPGLMSMTYHNLSPGNYSFLIQDYANDGICCNFGEGYVRISQVFDDDIADIDEKELWYKQGNFGAQASVEVELVPDMPPTLGNDTGILENYKSMQP